MDPLSAALALVTAIVNAHAEMLKGMTPEQRVQYAQMILDDMKAWRDFLKLFAPK